MPTQSEFAKHMGVTQQAISKLAQRGVFPKGGTLDDWRVAYVRHLIDQASGHVSEDGELDITEERALLARAQRLKLEIETDKLRGTLVAAADVERVWTGMLAAARAKLIVIPQRAASLVVAATSRLEAEEILRSLIWEALSELAEGGDYSSPADPEPTGSVELEIEPTPRPKAPAKSNAPRSKAKAAQKRPKAAPRKRS